MVFIRGGLGRHRRAHDVKRARWKIARARIFCSDGVPSVISGTRFKGEAPVLRGRWDAGTGGDYDRGRFMVLSLLVLVRIVANPVSNVFQKVLTRRGAGALFVILVTHLILGAVCWPVVVREGGRAPAGF